MTVKQQFLLKLYYFIETLSLAQKRSWLTADGAVQVYYAPRRPVYCQATLPTVLGGFALLR